jgi:hypothetical protein
MHKEQFDCVTLLLNRPRSSTRLVNSGNIRAVKQRALYTLDKTRLRKYRGLLKLKSFAGLGKISASTLLGTICLLYAVILKKIVESNDKEEKERSAKG